MVSKPVERIGDIRLYVRPHDPETHEGYALDGHFKEIARTKPFRTREEAKAEIARLVAEKTKVTS